MPHNPPTVHSHEKPTHTVRVRHSTLPSAHITVIEKPKQKKEKRKKLNLLFQTIFDHREDMAIVPSSAYRRALRKNKDDEDKVCFSCAFAVQLPFIVTEHFFRRVSRFSVSSIFFTLNPKTVRIILLSIVIPISAGLLGVSAFGIKENAITHTKNAVALLERGSSLARQNNLEDASKLFESAEREFNMAMRFIPFGQTKSLLLAGSESSSAFSIALANGATLKYAANNQEKLNTLEHTVRLVSPKLRSASRRFVRVDTEKFPLAYRDKIIAAQALVPPLTEALTEIEKAINLIHLTLGSSVPRRFLVVFQNDAEIRPTGGFMGSFALLDIKNGEITNIEIPKGGTYDLQGSLREYVRAPEPIRLINPRWEFQDANWMPHFPTTAKQIMSFYEQSGGPTTDGVIAITSGFAERLISAIGEIEVPHTKKIITANNFFNETQSIVESKKERETGKPKQFIADLALATIEKAKQSDSATLLAIGKAAYEGAKTKEILLYFSDKDLQNKANDLGFTGIIPNGAGDFLGIVNANIAGQKTDRVITQKTNYTFRYLPDNTMIGTVTVTRTHNGKKGEPFTGVRNVNYMRVFVPIGSELVEARGFSAPESILFSIPDSSLAISPTLLYEESKSFTDHVSGTRITEEENKTVFGNWTQTDPGEKTIVTITYRLPQNILSPKKDKIRYNLTLYKQPGMRNETVSVKIDVPKTYTLSTGVINLEESKLTQDKTLETVFIPQP